METDIFNTSKLTLTQESYGKFMLTVNDRYGHYVDDVPLDIEDLQCIYDGLSQLKEINKKKSE